MSAEVRDRLSRGLLGLIEVDGAIFVVPRRLLRSVSSGSRVKIFFTSSHA